MVPTSMPDLFENFRALVRILGDASIPFAVCGGLAMSIHAHPRATIDIDLLAPADAIPPLVETVASLGFVRRARAPMRLGGGEIVMHRLTKIVAGDPDVLSLDVIEVGGLVTARAWQTRVSAQWEGRPLTVVSREGLVALKRLRGSPQDLVDIVTLEGTA